MINTVARFVVRVSDGLFIGCCYKQQLGTLKPNTVYEIRDVMGVLSIVELGQGIGGGPAEENCYANKITDITPFHWAQDIGDIIATQQNHILLTEKEYIQLLKNQKSV